MAQSGERLGSSKELIRREFHEAPKSPPYCYVLHAWSDEDMVGYYNNSLNPTRAVAFMALFYRYGKPLLEYIDRKLGSDEQVFFDVWGKMWVKLLEPTGLATYNPSNSSLLPWLYIFADHRIYEYFHDRERYAPLVTHEENTGGSNNSLYDEQLNISDARHIFLSQDTIQIACDWAETIIARLDDESHDDLAPPNIEESLIFRDIIKLLSKHQRTVLKLKFNTNMTHKQVASELGISVGAVKAVIHRAITMLRGMLNARLQEGDSNHD